MSGGKDLVYKVSSWDEYSYNQYLGADRNLEKGVRAAGRRIPGFERFSVEIFHRLFSEPNPLEVVKPEHAWAVKAHEALDTSEDFQSLVEQCFGDRFSSGVGAAKFIQEIVDRLPVLPEKKDFVEPQKLREEIGREHKGLKSLQDMLKETIQKMEEERKEGEAKEGGTEEGSEPSEEAKALEDKKAALEEGIAEAKERIEGMKAEGKAAVAEAMEEADAMAEAVGEAIAEASKEAKVAAEEFTESMNTFSLSDSWDSDAALEMRGDLAEKIKLAAKFNQLNLKEIMKLYGRLKPIAAKKQKSKRKAETGEIDGLEFGDDISRLLPSELMLLDDEDFFPAAAAAIADGAALQYAKRSKAKQGKGSILILMDSTGSMRQGSRHAYAMACALCVIKIAMQQKRHVRVMHYGNGVRGVDEFSPRDNSVESSERLMKCLTTFYADSTNFESKALDEAISYMQGEQPGFGRVKHEDILFITDGGFMRGASCRFDYEGWLEQFNATKKRLGFSVYTLAIDCEGEQNKYFQSMLEQDKVANVRPGRQENPEIEKIFGM